MNEMINLKYDQRQVKGFKLDFTLEDRVEGEIDFGERQVSFEAELEERSPECGKVYTFVNPNYDPSFELGLESDCVDIGKFDGESITDVFVLPTLDTVSLSINSKKRMLTHRHNFIFYEPSIKDHLTIEEFTEEEIEQRRWRSYVAPRLARLVEEGYSVDWNPTQNRTVGIFLPARFTKGDDDTTGEIELGYCVVFEPKVYTPIDFAKFFTIVENVRRGHSGPVDQRINLPREDLCRHPEAKKLYDLILNEFS